MAPTGRAGSHGAAGAGDGYTNLDNDEDGSEGGGDEGGGGFGMPSSAFW
jgi:hypothetical protein